MLQTLALGGKILEELHSGTSLEDAIRDREEAIREHLAPYDTVHLLAQLMLHELPLDPDTYQETEHEGLAHVVEGVAAELARRPDRRGDEQPTPPVDARLIEQLHALAQELALLVSFRRSRAAGGPQTPEGAARSRAAMQHVMVRGPGWAWQEHAALRGLFGPPHLESKLRDRLGFTADDAIACTEAAAALFPARIRAHAETTRDAIAAFDAEHPAHVWASQVLDGWQSAPPEQQATYISALWAYTHIGDELLLTADDLASQGQVSVDAATGFLSALATPIPHSVDGWFPAAEFVRHHPYLAVSSDSFLLTVPGNDLWALRGVFEEALKGDQGYLRHRGRWLEERAVEILVEALAPDGVHRGVTYAITAESGESQDGEIDGLLRIGDVALLVEAKAATLRPGARRGGEALLKHLRETLTRAAEQSRRATRALETGVSLYTDGKPLELGDEIREVHAITVTLDDLSSVAPMLWQLQGSRILPAGTHAPWLVTLHELDLICQTVEWPGQLVHFLRRRARLNERGGVDATDELDLWMHYLVAGLYFEDAGSEPIRLASFTDELDAWVLYEQGLRETPAPKPSINIDDTTRRFLDVICEERPPAWVPAACSMLEMSGAARSELWEGVENLRALAVERDRPQRCTLWFEEGPIPMLVCAVVMPDADVARTNEALHALVEERMAEFGPQRVLAIGTTVSSDRPYTALLVVEKVWRGPSTEV
jgi:hypothetical protein